MADDASTSKPDRGRWPPCTEPVAHIRLLLDEPCADGEDPPTHDISAAARIGQTLFLAADESAHLEALHRLDGARFAEHQRTVLSDMFDLPVPGGEMDIEGLAIDGEWLWVVGSHSLTRKKPKKKKPVDEAALERLAELKDNPNRMFLGRLPIRRGGGGPDRWEVSVDETSQGGPLMLPIGKRGSALARKLSRDPHLAPFLALPAKENGLDIEGLIVDGERLGLGLRGPVINGWAFVLELQVRPHKGALTLVGGVRKHWLDLGGLGIRDLKRRGEDVIILAGPTMNLDGPAQVYRWRGWGAAAPDAGLHKPEWLMDLPFGQSCDHPEALAPWEHEGRPALLVVCDSPAPGRLQSDGVAADVFLYPPAPGGTMIAP
jgi:hypothetical protein